MLPFAKKNKKNFCTNYYCNGEPLKNVQKNQTKNQIECLGGREKLGQVSCEKHMPLHHLHLP